MLLTGIFIGFMAGIFITTITLAVYGDSELNEQIHSIRKARLEIAKTVLEIKIKKLLLLGRDRGYVLKISTGPKKDSM